MLARPNHPDPLANTGFSDGKNEPRRLPVSAKVLKAGITNYLYRIPKVNLFFCVTSTTRLPEFNLRIYVRFIREPSNHMFII